MNSVSYDISQLIEFQSEGEMVFAQNLFIGREPAEIPASTVITLFDTSSASPSSTYSGSDYMYDSIQIRIRSNYEDAFVMATNLKRWLHNKIPGLINGTYYKLVRLNSGPAVLDYDEKDRVRIVMNFIIHRTDDTNIVIMNLGDIEFHVGITDSSDPFPDVGQSNVLYVDKGEQSQYLWDIVSEAYVQIGGGGGGVTVHNETTDRDAEDAHPQSAVTGLVDDLAAKQDKPIVSSLTIPAASWVADEQTVTVTGVTADNEVDVIIETQVDGDLWADANIYVISQGIDTLTFSCETTPTDDIQIKVRIWL